ncbi:hypothetical protein [Ekhidna sp.]|uniref:hypothetical protein n=1 Tax=Ekhidna sp. TaxID=2608089 RepID=UPI003B507209
MNKYLGLIPFFYFQQTRLNTIKSFVFHSYMEWLSAILILFLLEGFTITNSVQSFIVGYLIFISIYEIGYIANDHLSIRKERNPRKRSVFTNTFQIVLAVSIRLFFFLFVIYVLDAWYDIRIWVSYSLLVITFIMHNSIKMMDYRLLSFINLAILRYFLPIIIFLDINTIQLLLPPVLLGYVLFRSFIYADSKDLLSLINGRTNSFNLFFYLLLTPTLLFISYLTKSYVPILAFLYPLPIVALSFLKTTQSK